MLNLVCLVLGSKDYYPPDAYNQSKLAQVLFTRHLQLLINQDEDLHVQVHAVHPGVVDTDLFVHSSTTYVPWFKKLFFKVKHTHRTCLNKKKYSNVVSFLEHRRGITNYRFCCNLTKN